MAPRYTPTEDAAIWDACHICRDRFARRVLRRAPWRYRWLAASGEPGSSEPDGEYSPGLLVWVEPGIAHDPEAALWSGDAERCIAWALIEGPAR